MTAPHAAPSAIYGGPPGIRSYWSSLTGNQVKVLCLIADLSGPRCEWVSIGITAICQHLGMRRQSAIDALRGVIACGLIERTVPKSGARHFYRLNPSIPTRNPRLITGRSKGERLVSIADQQAVAIPDQSTGTKNVTSYLHLEIFSEPHKEERDISLTKSISSSSAVSEKADEDGTASDSQKSLEPASPTYSEFRSMYPKEKLDDAKARIAFNELAPLDRTFCFRGLIAHLTCDRWVRSLANDAGRYIPLASNFISRREYAGDPPPHLSPRLNAAEQRQQAKSEEMAARARRIFEKLAREANV